jgi:hypothetical protein
LFKAFPASYRPEKIITPRRFAVASLRAMRYRGHQQGRNQKKENEMSKWVIVNDGQCRWGADRQLLLDTLTSQGWTYDRGMWVEPATEDQPGAAYSLLCAAVPPLAGEGSDDPEWTHAPDTMDEFAYRPDWGGWEYSRA